MQDPQRPATIDNLVLLTHAEADVHDELQTLNALWQQVGIHVGGRAGGAAGLRAAVSSTPPPGDHAYLVILRHR